MSSKTRTTCAAILVALLPWAAPVARAERSERTFERTFAVAGAATLDGLTRTGRVTIRVGGEGSVVVRGRVMRNVSWNGARVADSAIESLRQSPPVRLDGTTVRLERIADDALWRGVSIDYEIVVPAATTIRIVTESGAVTIAGSRGDVRAKTGSGAIRVDAEAGQIELHSGSGAVRVGGRMAALTMTTQSGSILAATGSIEAVKASSGSGSVTISGVRGTASAETGSSQIRIDGDPTGDWHVRSRSGSVTLRVPADSRFDVLAISRSGDISVAHPVAGQIPVSKHHVEGSVNGGGPTLDVETGSSQITVRP